VAASCAAWLAGAGANSYTGVLNGPLWRRRVSPARSIKKPVKEQPPRERTRSEAQVIRSKEAALKATFALLMEHGLSGVSVDEVAKRSGIAKTTIYRHWPSRTELMLDACSKLGAKFDVPDTGSVKGDVMAIAMGISARLRSKNYSSVLPSVIDAAERDGRIAALHGKIHSQTLAPLYVVLERARGRGELRENWSTADIVASVVGPLFYRRWFSREPLDDRFVKSVVKRALGTDA